METSNPGKCNYSYLTRIWLEMFVPSFIFAAINNEWETRFIGWSKCPTSVTRWPDCFFNLSPFTTIKFCPKAYKKSQSGFTTFQNIKETFQMLPKIYKFLLIWRNFAKSGHAVVPKPKKVPRLFFIVVAIASDDLGFEIIPIRTIFDRLLISQIRSQTFSRLFVALKLRCFEVQN